LPSNKTEHKKKFAKRLLSMSGIWSLFSDFAICPTLCSKASLKNILDSLLASGQQPTVFYQPDTPPPKIKPSEPIVSMNGFYKVPPILLLSLSLPLSPLSLSLSLSLSVLL
jgi:hypothetical protein